MMSYSAWQYTQAGYVHSAGGPNCSGILVNNPNPLLTCFVSVESVEQDSQTATDNNKLPNFKQSSLGAHGASLSDVYFCYLLFP